ncbi:MAG: DUF6159 family protein [Actinomycetota bacterium]
MGSVSRGFRLAKASWSVVKNDRELLWLPVISFFCSLVVMAVFGLGMLGIGLPSKGQSISPGIYALGFVMYVALAFVTIYFNAAVIGTAMKRLRGEDAKISDGLALAREHIGKIFVWALITATVGMILRQFQERAGLLGRVLVGLVGIAWSVLTYFVVPVLLFEPVGVGESIKRSGAIFRQRWGEQFIGSATIGLAVVVIAIPVAIVGGLIAAAVPLVGVPLLIVAIGGLMAIGAAGSGVFNAALYRYATTGEASGAFSVEDMNASFRPRRGSGRGGFMGGIGGLAGGGGFTGRGFGGGTTTMPAPPTDEPERPDL